MELPQEYWRDRTLKEIASAVGTPIDIDGPTRNHTFGHYARILVDIDLSKRVYDEILVEREGFTFKVEVQYERRPLFCHYYYSIGHNVSSCHWLHLQPPKDKNDRGKQIVLAEAAPKHTRHNNNNNHVGASTSANGSTWVPVVSTVTTTQRVPVSATSTPTPTSLVSASLDLPASFPSPNLTLNPQLGPVVTSTVANNSHMDMSNTLSFPLHNEFDTIAPRELPHTMPVLDVTNPSMIGRDKRSIFSFIKDRIWRVATYYVQYPCSAR